MIPQLALILYVFVAVGMFAVMKPLRAFLLTYLIGYLVLPVEVGSWEGWQGTIVLTQSLRLDKLTACNVGAVIGTLLFASKKFAGFRFHWADIGYGIVLVGMVLTSLANGVGLKEGLSHGIEELRQFAPLILLSRMYLRTPEDLLEAARAVVGGAFCYAFLCVGEWRLSPQTHRLVYGYFQHSFDQFARYGFFRPVGFLHHAIELATFMATSTALAGWLWFKGMMKPLWGLVPAPLVVGWVFVGLVTTMTFSGYGALLMMGALLGLYTVTRTRWVLVILPVVAVVWMAGRYTGAIDAGFLLRTSAAVDPSRSESLEYRLEAERINIADSKQNLWLGKGTMNAIATDESGKIARALDAWWLITLVFYGVVSVAGWYILWMGGIVETLRKWGKMDKEFRALAMVIGVLIGAQFIDFLFNSFPSPFLFMLDMGLIGALQHGARRAAAPVVWVPVYDYVEGEVAT